MTQDANTHLDVSGAASHSSAAPVCIAILGGTGKQGGGLALRWASAGYDVVIGSRQAEKAERVTAELNAELGEDRIRGHSNAMAAALADIAVLTVPYNAHSATLSGLRKELQGKILVDVTVPLKPPQVAHVHLPQDGPAAVQAQALLGDQVRVVAALQNVSEHVLRDVEREIDCDVLVCGDDAEAKTRVMWKIRCFLIRGAKLVSREPPKSLRACSETAADHAYGHPGPTSLPTGR